MAGPMPDDEGRAEPGPVIRDRRRLDPETGKVREQYATKNGDGDGSAQADPPAEAAEESEPGQEPAAEEETVPVAELAAVQAQADERLADLKRLQAEYVNYRRRVERDKPAVREFAVNEVLESLLPVLDDIHLARQHGDLEGTPFAAIAEKLDKVLGGHGLVRYGEPGETFDPAVHDALMHIEAELAEGTTATTVVQVLQPGYRAGERVLRAARVAVADPPSA